LKNLEKSFEKDSILSRAETLREQSLYPQSLKLFKQALRRLLEMKDFEGIYHCLIASGDLYRMTGDFDLAAENYADAIAVARESGSRAEVADAKVGLGLSLRAQGKWKEAIKFISESRKVYKKNNDVHGIAFTLWAEGGALRIKGDIMGAIETFRESHRIFKSMGDVHGVGYCICGLGGASRMAGRFKDSLRHYKAANSLFTSLRDRFGKAYSFCGIGNAYRMLGDYKNALAYFAKATRIYTKIGDKVSYAYTLWGLGTAYKMMGDYKKAGDYFSKALRFFKKTKDPRGVIYCNLGFGEIALLEGKKAAAKRYCAAALQGSKKHEFALEKCHAETLFAFVDGPCSSDSLKKRLPGKKDITCYDRLGLKLRFQALPLNIP